MTLGTAGSFGEEGQELRPGQALLADHGSGPGRVESEDCEAETQHQDGRVKMTVGCEYLRAPHPRLGDWLALPRFPSGSSCSTSLMDDRVSLPPESVLYCLGLEVHSTSPRACRVSVRSPQFYLINISTES